MSNCKRIYKKENINNTSDNNWTISKKALYITRQSCQNKNNIILQKKNM